MSTSIDINSSIYDRLKAIASAQNCELQSCLEQALSEYIDNYEDSQLDEETKLENLERSFFFAAE